MSDACAYARSRQALFAMSGDEFGKATELSGAEAGSGTLVNPRSSGKKNHCRQPSPRGPVERQVSPRAVTTPTAIHIPIQSGTRRRYGERCCERQ